MIRTTAGRMVEAFNQPLPGGGWVTTHEDVTERREAEQQVREQKLQLDAALDSIAQGLLMFGADGRLILCNRRYLELYGLPADAVKPGTTLQELLELRKANGTFGRDPEGFIDLMKAALTGGKTKTFAPELEDGRIISIQHHPLGDGRWVSTHEDITERRRADQQLREQKLQLDTALNNMSQGLNMFDASGRLVVCNDRYLKMYGVSAEVAKPGCTVDDLVKARIASGTFFSADPERYAAELLEAMRRRESTRTTMELTDGRIVAVVSHPTPDGGGWVVTHEDITERRRAEMRARPEPGVCHHRDRKRAGHDRRQGRAQPALRAVQSRGRGLLRHFARGRDRQGCRRGVFAGAGQFDPGA